MIGKRAILFTLSITFLLLLNCTSKDPVKDLTNGRSGKVYFSSDNSTFKERFDNNKDFDNVTINGTLKLPKMKSEKVPAVVILHGMGGVVQDVPKEHITNLAENLNNIGLATFIIDSQTPREARMATEVLSKVTLSMRVSDAYAALHLLSTHPNIDKERIGVVGISRGGNVALISQSERVRACYINEPDLKFSAMLLLYPSCWLRLQDWDIANVPILMLLGEVDNIAPAATSMGVANQLKDKNIDIKVRVFDDAFHAFDFDFFEGNKFEWFIDLSGCQDQYLVLDDDGLIYSTYHRKTVEDARNLKFDMSECSEGKTGYLGGPKGTKKEAEEEYTLFFKRVFSL